MHSISRLLLGTVVLTIGAATLAGCGAQQEQGSGFAPQHADGALARSLVAAMFRRHALPPNVDRAASWVSPAAKHKDLVYLSNGGTGDVTIFSYPTMQAVGELTGFSDPAGVCSDPKGNVWVVSSLSTKVAEYAHGHRKPVAKLNDDDATYPLACAVDPTTGNLVVTDLGNPTGGGAVLLYTDAKGSPEILSSSAMSFVYFAAYDSSGNLFVDGEDKNYNFVLMELPVGGSQFETISLSGTIDFPGGIEWDGQYVAVGDQAYEGGHTSVIDDVSVSGSTGTIAATVALTQSCDVTQFAIVPGSSSTVVAPDVCLNDAFVYAYPGGGDPTNTVTGLQYPFAAALSVVHGTR